jgi:hypothetical protein
MRGTWDDILIRHHLKLAGIRMAGPIFTVEERNEQEGKTQSSEKISSLLFTHLNTSDAHIQTSRNLPRPDPAARAKSAPESRFHQSILLASVQNGGRASAPPKLGQHHIRSPYLNVSDPTLNVSDVSTADTTPLTLSEASSQAALSKPKPSEAERSLDSGQDVVEQVVEWAQWGRSFRVEWIQVEPLTFEQTRHIHNPWNNHLPVKVSRDGTEIEPHTGELLLEEWDRLNPETSHASVQASPAVPIVNRVGQSTNEGYFISKHF